MSRVVRAQMGGEPLENGAAVRGPRERPADPVLAPVRGEVGGELRHAGRELVGPQRLRSVDQLLLRCVGVGEL